MKSKAHNIREGVHKAILSCLDNPRSLQGEFSLINDLGFDSMQIAALTFRLEEELNMEIQLNDWLGMAHLTSDLTIDSLVKYIEQSFLLSQ